MRQAGCELDHLVIQERGPRLKGIGHGAHIHLDKHALRQIAVIIGYVDSEPEEAAINYKVYPLENQDPEDLSGILNQLIQETIESKADKAGKIVTTTKKLEEDISQTHIGIQQHHDAHPRPRGSVP